MSVSGAGGPGARQPGVLRTAFYWVVKGSAWPVAKLYLRMSVEGRERVPRSGPVLVVANHTSYLDAALLGSAFPRRIRFLITLPIYSMRRLTWFYYMMGSIPLAPDAPDPRALKTALRTLQTGGVVGIFPEGQRMPDGALGEPRAGVALIAARSGALVVPAAILGAHRSMPVGSMIPRPHRVRVVFGDPIAFPAAGQGRPDRARLEAFADQIMRTIESLMNNTAPDDAAGNPRRASS